MPLNPKTNAALPRPVPLLVSRPSILHCKILCFLIGCVLSVQSLRPDYSDVSLSVALDTIKIGIAADLIFLTTNWIKIRYFSHKVVRFLLTMISSTTEVVLAFLLLNDGRVPEVETFLLGSAYAKPMVVGALSLLVHGVSIGLEPRNATSHIWFHNIRHLGYGGLLVVVAAVNAESKGPSCLSED
jgi:Ca2+/H+ antiporter